MRNKTLLNAAAFLATVVGFTVVCAIAQTRPAAVAPPKPFTPEPLPPGWDQIDERLVFLTIRISSVEASIEAVEKAIKATGYSKAAKADDAQHARKGNELMDRKGGGPVPWQEFYGRTAQDFYFHPGTVMAAHSTSGSGRETDARAVHTDTPTPVNRPPQLDYIYRANSDNQKRAEAAVAELGGKIDKLLERRRSLETEQSALWSEIAFQAVASRDFSSKPIYRFDLKTTSNDTSIGHAAAAGAACDFVRTVNQLMGDAQKGAENDPGMVFHEFSQAISAARKKMNDGLAEQESIALDLSDNQSKISKVVAAAKRLDDLAKNMDESYHLARDGDGAGDDQRKNTFRGLLQDGLLNTADTLLTADQCVLDVIKDWKLSPDLKKPAAEINAHIDIPAANDVAKPAGGAAPVKAENPSPKASDAKPSIVQPTTVTLNDQCGVYVDEAILQKHLTPEQLEVVRGLRIGKIALPERRGMTYFHIDVDIDNQSPRGRIENELTVDTRVLCVDADGKQNVTKYSKRIDIGAKGNQSVSLGSDVYLKTIKVRNNNSEIPQNAFVSFRLGDVEFYRAFLSPPSGDQWWLNDDLVVHSK